MRSNQYGPVHVVLDVFLARPDDLDRAVDLLGDLAPRGSTPSASSRRPKPPPIRWLCTTTFSSGRPAAFAAAAWTRAIACVPTQISQPSVADMNRAVHRLHRRVREERHLVDRLDLGGGARHRLVGIADVLRHRARLERRLLELAQRSSAVVSLRVRAVVPFDHQRRQALLRGAHVIGDDRDGIVEPHDLPHAFDGLRRGVVDALDAAAEHRRLRQRRDLHARRPSIDAVDGGAVDLRRQCRAAWPACRSA